MEKDRQRYSQTCVYHKTEPPKIVNQQDAQTWYDQGWADTPAAFFDMKKQCFNPDSQIEGQAVGEAITNEPNEPNDKLNVEKMTKKELIIYAKKNFDVTLHEYSYRKALIKEVKALIKLQDKND